MKTLISCLLLLPLAGCSLFGDTFRDRSNDYRHANNIAKLEVPDELSRDNIVQLYAIPEGSKEASYQFDDDFRVPRPDLITSATAENEVKIQTLDGKSWILVTSPASSVWPTVRNFLARNGLGTLSANAETGEIITDWFSFVDSDDLHQFRFIVEKGVRLNTTEVAVHNRSYTADSFPTQVPDWISNQGNGSEREKWMQQKVAENLASVSDIGTVSVAGNEIGGGSKVALITPEASDPFMVMKLSMARGWAAVGYALNTEGFTRTGLDIDTGVYTFSFVDPTLKKRGFTKRLFMGKRKPTDYRATVSSMGEILQVRVTDSEGSSLSQREAYKVLSLIRANLT